MHQMYVLNELNAAVHIIRLSDSWASDAVRWSCSIKGGTDGVKVEVHVSAPTMEEAIEEATAKFLRAIDHGVGRASLIPAIEHKPAKDPNDDFPF